ncbi:S-adenosyl-L-methionine-dependent methyltransferase [Halteromyces radiatus]|uniref:S-adenosyl-L-methionine-dependent methyltransferase n=1 Tax=Halteromyces radiatus TaxID=101107 RepID=UPI00221F9E5C|nr:S-adenosyl-L-methionine-dependent methyltransferase [Halteromyces radiatus]KAI8081748.1 S-adenosyl-L-methionine-dependent methyltransferase [Halteromyces radiatus]
MVRLSVNNKYTTLIRRLLPACDNDISLAKRQIIWMKEKIIMDRHDIKNTSTLLTTEELNRLDTFVQQRVEQHKPLQYILGTQPFYGLDILTRPPTLIPRWETEEWTHRLVELIQPYWKKQQGRRRRILDICTGSGCIALALAAHLPSNSTDILGLDISTEAIKLANDNLVIHQNQLNGNQVQFQIQDIYQAKVEKLFDDPWVDLVVSNPPYVTHTEYVNLEAEVKQWEDKRALVADNQGILLHQRLIELVSKNNNNKKKDGDELLPRLIMEIGGEHQVSSLKQILDSYGFRHIKIWKDLAGKDRVILAS